MLRATDGASEADGRRSSCSVFSLSRLLFPQEEGKKVCARVLISRPCRKRQACLRRVVQKPAARRVGEKKKLNQAQKKKRKKKPESKSEKKKTGALEKNGGTECSPASRGGAPPEPGLPLGQEKAEVKGATGEEKRGKKNTHTQDTRGGRSRDQHFIRTAKRRGSFRCHTAWGVGRPRIVAYIFAGARGRTRRLRHSSAPHTSPRRKDSDRIPFVLCFERATANPSPSASKRLLALPLSLLPPPYVCRYLLRECRC